MPDRHGILAIDVGTSSTKAVLFEPGGSIVGSAHRGYPMLTPHPGWAEQDPDAVVTAALDAMTAVAAAAGRQRVTIVALGLSTAMHTLLGLDADRRPVTPLLTWADERALDQAERLRADPAGQRLAGRSGTPLHPMSPLPKLIWLRAEQPDTFAAARYWGGIKEYLLHRLCGGDLRVDRSTASATGLYDVLAGDWDNEALALAGVSRSQLAALVGSTERIGPISAAVADRTGLPVGTPVIAGGSDGALANVGVGAVHPGTLACSIGTSAALRVTVDRPVVDPAGRLFCYALDDRHWIIGGATNNGGNVLGWLRAALAPELPPGSAERTLLDLAGQAPPGASGLLMLPYLAGERAPRWHGNPRGVYFGLTHQHRREHLVRAGLEAVCLQLALVLRAMEDTGVEVSAVRATGGFARNPLWRRLLADVLGRPIGFPKTHEGSALGAAIVGMQALGIVDSIDVAADLAPVAHIESPTEAAAVYRRLLPLYSALYDALEPAYDTLAQLVGDLPATGQLGHRSR
jgi:gluconokinase